MKNLILGTDAISKAINSINTRGRKLDNDIQLAGMSVINHVELHGDITLVNRLVDAMPNGSRVNALRSWISAFGKVIYNEETKSFDYNKLGKTDLDGGAEKVWFEFKPEAEFSFDLAKAFASLLKSAENAGKKAKSDAIKIDPALLTKLQAITPATTTVQ
jgi:hypothetical protein